METIGERFLFVRKFLKKKYREITEDTGIDDSLYGSIEKGRRKATDRTIKALCSVYSVNEDWLRTGDGEPFLKKKPEPVLSEREIEIRFILNTYSQLDENTQKKFLEAFERIKSGFGAEPETESADQELGGKNGKVSRNTPRQDRKNDGEKGEKGGQSRNIA